MKMLLTLIATASLSFTVVSTASAETIGDFGGDIIATPATTDPVITETTTDPVLTTPTIDETFPDLVDSDPVDNPLDVYAGKKPKPPKNARYGCWYTIYNKRYYDKDYSDAATCYSSCQSVCTAKKCTTWECVPIP